MNRLNIKQKKVKAKSLFNKRDYVGSKILYSELCNEMPDEESYFMLGVIFNLLSDPVHAQIQFSKALKLNPDSDTAWGQLGNTQYLLGEYELAAKSFHTSISINPNNAQSLNNLGNIYRDLGKFAEAESCYRKAIAINNKDAISLNNLANIYLTLCNYDQAEIFYKEAIKNNKSYFDAYYNLGATYQGKGDYKLALNYYKRARKLSPQNIQTDSAIANLYEKQGDIQKSLEYLKPLMNQNIITPDIAETYSNICIKKKTYDAGIKVIEKCLSHDTNPINEQMLRFSLGDLFDKKGQYSNAFNEYTTANNMRPFDYNKSATENYFKSIKNTFIPLGNNPICTSGSKSDKPIFIVGMPRSGSTLIEQILSSHNVISGAGELHYIPGIAAQIPFPDNVPQLNEQWLGTLAKKYLDNLSKHDANARRITDKLPHNFLFIGLIRLLFPNSKIIHCNRNALDVCLSIYFHNFNQNHPYSDKLENLGHYYNLYGNLMDTWNELYDNFILNVSYENLLTDPDNSIRAMLNHLDLEWDANCLNFHANKRTVSTPSYDQVRQPFYTSSVSRWRNYSEHIDPLVRGLESRYIDDIEHI